MGLIEKAFEQTRNGGTGTVENPVQPLKSVEGAKKRPVTQFDLDLDNLDKQGFLTDPEKNGRLSLEMRLLKRRLLRRLGFLRNKGSAHWLGGRGKRHRNVVMVTSTRPAEGKTFIASNIALSLALEDDMNVLLVDADSPRPKIQSHFGLRARRGFTDLINDPSMAPEDVMLNARHTRLSIMPEGSPVSSSSELFATPQVEKLLTNLSTENSERLVILDVPPVLATTEAVILAPFVDEIIFVVEADGTPEQAIASAIEELLDVNPNVSLVLNKCLIGAGGSHYGSYSDYYPRGARRHISTGANVASKS